LNLHYRATFLKEYSLSRFRYNGSKSYDASIDWKPSTTGALSDTDFFISLVGEQMLS